MGGCSVVGALRIPIPRPRPPLAPPAHPCHDSAEKRDAIWRASSFADARPLAAARSRSMVIVAKKPVATLFLGAHLICLSGCAQLGVRLLPADWKPVETQFAKGITLPLSGRSGTRWVFPLQYLASDASRSGHTSDIDDLSAGIDFALLGRPPEFWSESTSSTYAYVGGGISALFAEMSDGVTGDQESVVGGFVHAGVWWYRPERSTFLIGFECRYTMADAVHLNGIPLDMNSLQLLIVCLGFPY